MAEALDLGGGHDLGNEQARQSEESGLAGARASPACASSRMRLAGSRKLFGQVGMPLVAPGGLGSLGLPKDSTAASCLGIGRHAAQVTNCGSTKAGHGSRNLAQITAHRSDAISGSGHAGHASTANANTVDAIFGPSAGKGSARSQ